MRRSRSRMIAQSSRTSFARQRCSECARASICEDADASPRVPSEIVSSKKIVPTRRSALAIVAA
jgi:hypothetical protein